MSLLTFKNSTLMTVLVVSGFSLTFTSAQAAAEGSEYWHHGWDTGHMVFGGFFMLLFWVGIIVAIFMAIRMFGRDFSSSSDSIPNRITALEILNERFARGDIDKDEFEERKNLLSEQDQ